MKEEKTEKMTFGCDAEFFMKDKKGKLVSAIGKIPGSKEYPYILKSGAGIHPDNVSLELIFKPFDNFMEFNSHVQDTFKEISKELEAVGYTLSNKVSHFFPDEELLAPESMVMGCSPDMNAWTGDFNPAPILKGEIKNLRCNGAHPHIGHPAINVSNHCLFVKNLDYRLGVWSLNHDSDLDRRKLYGKAGAFRPKPYGVEYRVLSNFWTFSSALRAKVFDTCKLLIQELITDDLHEVGELVQRKINKNGSFLNGAE